MRVKAATFKVDDPKKAMKRFKTLLKKLVKTPKQKVKKSLTKKKPATGWPK